MAPAGETGGGENLAHGQAWEILAPAILILAAGIMAVVIARRLKLSPIVGYVAAGLALGPFGLDLVDHHAPATELLAELGVVFLLFDIGLHFSIGRVWSARTKMVGMGGLGMIACLVPLGIVSFTIYAVPALPAILVGAALALSSTAVVTQILADTGRRTSPIGATAIAVLVFQDVIAIFLLILAEAMGEDGGALGPALGLAALKTAAAVLTAVALSRTVVNPLFRALSASKNEEVFVAVSLLLALTAAAAAGAAGLSLTLGAFLAGMMIAESPYRHRVQAEMNPFRGLLMGFFFIVTGVRLDLSLVASAWPTLLGGLALLTVLKAGAFILAARAFRWTWSGSVEFAFLMAQASEFALVIFALPAVADSMGQRNADLTLAVATASLALAPVISLLGDRIARWTAEKRFDRSKSGEDVHTPNPLAPVNGGAPVAVIGMTQVGRLVADALKFSGIPFMATDSTHERFTKAVRDGYPVVFGDMADPRLMEALDIGDKPAIVVTTKNYEVAKRVNPLVSARYPRLKRFIGVDDEREARQFGALGMTPVILNSEPKGLELALTVAAWRGADSEKLAEWARLRHEEALSALAQSGRGETEGGEGEDDDDGPEKAAA